MAAVIIRKKDLEIFGEKLKQKIFNFLHDEYILTNFESMKVVQEKFLKKLILNHVNTLHRKYLITEEKRQELYESLDDPLPLLITSLDGKNVMKEEKEKFIKDAMKVNGVDIEGIYHILLSLNLVSELDEDLYFEKAAFLDIFRVFNHAYIYLEN